jgi:tRNA(Ile)-lysidine synthase
MNGDLRFTRSRIRSQLIPAIESAAGPKAINHLAGFASMAASDAAYLDQLAKAAFDRLLCSPGKLDASGVRALAPPLQTRVLARLLLEAGAYVDRAAVVRAQRTLTSAGRATLSRGFEIRSAGGTLRCTRAALTKAQPAMLSLSEGWVADSASGLWIGISAQPPTNVENAEWVEIGNAPLPLSIRRRRRGDRVAAVRGTRGAKLQDLMVDLGIPSEERDAIPVVCDAAGRILWVIGVWPRTRSFGAKSPSPRVGRYLVVEKISPPASTSRPRSL